MTQESGGKDIFTPAGPGIQSVLALFNALLMWAAGSSGAPLIREGVFSSTSITPPVAFDAALTVCGSHVLSHAPQRKGLVVGYTRRSRSRSLLLFRGKCISLPLHSTFPPLRHRTQNNLSNEPSEDSQDLKSNILVVATILVVPEVFIVLSWLTGMYISRETEIES